MISSPSETHQLLNSIREHVDRAPNSKPPEEHHEENHSPPLILGQMECGSSLLLCAERMSSVSSDLYDGNTEITLDYVLYDAYGLNLKGAGFGIHPSSGVATKLNQNMKS
ncbi:hypothetical protein WA026_006949 [Henosepilachna vigintioctopunctata]|uniref:Uncharacterized protein n=1 Tax=Henosepilachna vigintioctopunctata TaxID=420089 RepID=A0AAW1VBA8_9CUCU